LRCEVQKRECRLRLLGEERKRGELSNVHFAHREEGFVYILNYSGRFKEKILSLPNDYPTMLKRREEGGGRRLLYSRTIKGKKRGEEGRGTIYSLLLLEPTKKGREEREPSLLLFIPARRGKEGGGGGGCPFPSPCLGEEKEREIVLSPREGRERDRSAAPSLFLLKEGEKK